MTGSLKLPIYFDNHATTPMDPRVVEAMLPYFTEKFGNYASVGHVFGRELQKPVAEARAAIAKLIHCRPDEIIFTSGATESNNLAIKGVGDACGSHGRHILTCKTEHKCVLNTCKYLEDAGFEVTYLDVDAHGQVSAEQIRGAMRRGRGGKDKTILVSVMLANNEVGTINPIAEIAKVCREAGVLLHVDAAQAVGKIPVDVATLGAHFVSFTAHKMYGPKGIGALFVRKSDPCVKLSCQMQGGGQEGGYRSGTLPVPLVVAFGKACAIASEELGQEVQKLHAMRQRLLAGLTEKLEVQFVVNGHPEDRLPGNLNISFVGIDPELLGVSLKDVAVSSGSACTSAARPMPSHVLKALGHSDELALASVRFGIGRFNSIAEIDHAVAHVVAVVNRLGKSAVAAEAGAAAPVARCAGPVRV